MNFQQPENEAHQGLEIALIGVPQCLNVLHSVLQDQRRENLLACQQSARCQAKNVVASRALPFVHFR